MQVSLTRKEQKRQTRFGLIQAAAELFSKAGIAGTTTADIAKKLQVSHGTVFIHFPTREDLILAVIDDFGNKLSDEFNKNVETQTDLKELLRAHLEVLTEFEDFYFRLITEMHALPDSVRSTVFMLNAAVSWKIYEAAKPLIKNGKVRKIDRHLLFNTWIALLQYYIANRELLSEKKPILLEKREELLRHFLTLIKT